MCYFFTGLLLTMLLFQPPSYGQTPLINTTLNGKVTDADAYVPLEGVSIQIKGTTNGTTTDFKGEFRLLTAQKLPFTIVASYVGYQNEEILVSGNDITVQL